MEGNSGGFAAKACSGRGGICTVQRSLFPPWKVSFKQMLECNFDRFESSNSTLKLDETYMCISVSPAGFNQLMLE